VALCGYVRARLRRAESPACCDSSKLPAFASSTSQILPLRRLRCVSSQAAIRECIRFLAPRGQRLCLPGYRRVQVRRRITSNGDYFVLPTFETFDRRINYFYLKGRFLFNNTFEHAFNWFVHLFRYTKPERSIAERRPPCQNLVRLEAHEPFWGRTWRDRTTETLTMTLADRAAMAGHDGQVTGGQPGRPKRRTLAATYEARTWRSSTRCPRAALSAAR
jgi:hypothetical protein